MSETAVKYELPDLDGEPDYNQHYEFIRINIQHPDMVKHYLRLIYLQGKFDGIMESNKRR